jgi:hypothetical protein
LCFCFFWVGGHPHTLHPYITYIDRQTHRTPEPRRRRPTPINKWLHAGSWARRRSGGTGLWGGRGQKRAILSWLVFVFFRFEVGRVLEQQKRRRGASTNERRCPADPGL